MNEKQININLDLSKIENMKCHCGSEIFIPIVNMKYLSPIQIGNPNGGQALIQKFLCARKNCGQIYEKALPQIEIEKLYNSQKSNDVKIKTGAQKGFFQG